LIVEDNMKPIMSKTIEEILKDKTKSDSSREALFQKRDVGEKWTVIIDGEKYNIKSVPRNPK